MRSNPAKSPSPAPRLDREELARRGTKLYEETIRPRLEETHRGQVVAIDVESGAFEIAEDTLSAADRLLAHHPDAQTWFVRVGQPALHRIGPRRLRKAL